MRRTQIQLSDDIYKRAKEVAETREISLAELARRGLEYMLSVYAPESAGNWQPPTPRRLGWRGLSDAQLKDQAQMSSAEATLARAPKRRR
jgi:hypothetical protein